MRLLLLIAALLPAISYAAEWEEIGDTPEARIMLDRSSVEFSGGEGKAWLKFLYHEKQPGQTITLGKPFDSSTNQYYFACSTKKYQVLELVMFYKDKTVGSFHGHFDPDNLDRAKLQSGAMFLLDKICPAHKAGAGIQHD